MNKFIGYFLLIANLLSAVACLFKTNHGAVEFIVLLINVLVASLILTVLTKNR